MKKILFIVCLSIFISGCEDKNINAVKNIIPSSHRTNTIGNILDNRDICKKVKWSQFIDDKNRPIVKYQCFLKLDHTLDKDGYSAKQKKIESINKSIKGSLASIEVNKIRKNKREESAAYLTSLYYKFKNSPDIKKVRESGRTLIQLCHEASYNSYSGNSSSCSTKIDINKLRESSTSDVREYIYAINNLIEQDSLYQIDNKEYLDKSRKWAKIPTINYSDDTTSGIFLDLFNIMTEPSYSESDVLQRINRNYDTTSIDKSISYSEALIDSAPERIKTIESIKYLDFIETVKWSTININEPVMFQHTMCATTEKDSIKESRAINIVSSTSLYNTNEIPGEYAQISANWASERIYSISIIVTSCLNY